MPQPATRNSQLATRARSGSWVLRSERVSGSGPLSTFHFPPASLALLLRPACLLPSPAIQNPGRTALCCAILSFGPHSQTRGDPPSPSHSRHTAGRLNLKIESQAKGKPRGGHKLPLPFSLPLLRRSCSLPSPHRPHSTRPHVVLHSAFSTRHAGHST